jgi:NAD(P)-dependent dehydrogenase (short-subunit alcohol dehydrogenase family)
MTEFSNKVVVVTGGASGIGESIAKRFNDESAQVVSFGRHLDKLNQAKILFKQAIAVQGDVRNIADLDRLFQETRQAFGKIDVLVVNAGVASRRIVDDVDEQFFDDIVDTNFKGAYFTVQRAVRYLNEGASIVLISSAGCHFGWPSHSVYCAAKAAVSMLAKNFSADLIHRKIRVNAISPGYTKTPIWGQAHTEDYNSDVPMNRFATPEEIADAALFLSSSKASYIVGIDLVIDGGLTSFKTK